MKIITDFENYQVTEDGRVYAINLKRYLKPYSNGLGYMAVKLRKDGKRVMKYVHRLVAQEYVSPCVGFDINHKDGIKTNNAASNLEVVSHKENIQHAFNKRLLRGFIEKYY